MKRLIIGLAAVVVLAGVEKARAVVIDYDTTIDYRIEEDVRIIEGANPPTTVDFVEGADVQDEVNIYDSSIVNVLGGQFREVVEARDSSVVYVSGGVIGDGFEAEDLSTVYVSGGVFEYFDANYSSTVYVSGGVIESSLWGLDSSTVFVSGGVFDAVNSSNSSVITLYGSDFNYDYGPIPGPSGTLTGTLKNGDPVNALFEIHDDASIVLAVPEPSTLVLLAMGASGLMWYRLRKRR